MTISPSGLEFVQVSEVEGELSVGTQPGVPCRLRIQHDPSNRTQPTAQVYGTKTTYDQLLGLGYSARPYLTFRSKASVTQRTTVFSEQVVLHRLINPSNHDGVLGGREIGSVSFDSVTFRHSIGDPISNSNEKTRELGLLLQGPTSAWGVFGTEVTSYTGQVKATHFNTKIRLGARYPFSIRVSPHFFHRDIRSEDLPTALRMQGFAIYFRTTVPPSAFPDREFLSRALEIADDLITIVSFLSKDRLAWYMYHLTSGDSVSTEIRRVTYRVPRPIDFNELVVDPPDLRKFLRLAFQRYDKLRREKIDLSLPMRLYVSSFDAQFLEEQFIAAFRALECLVSLVRSPSGRQEYLKATEFKALRKVIASVIDSRLPARKAELIKHKLPELNRPSFAHSLEAMCRSLRISPSAGLYPLGIDPTLIKTRNKLIHDGRVDDLDFVHRETVRVRAVVERALLGLLGWKDFSRTPPHFLSAWLESKL